MSRTRIAPLLHAATATMIVAGAAAADLFAYEGFEYAPKPNLGGSSGGTGWASAWADVGAIPTGVDAAGLQWPGLLTTGGSAETPGSAFFEYSTYQRSLAAYSAPGDTIYLSFLLRPDADFGTGGGLRFGNWPLAMWVGSPPGYYAYGMMTSNGLGDFSNVELVPGQTAFLVVRIARNTATGKLVYSMWVDPEVDAPQPAFPDASYAIGGNLPQSVDLVNDGGFTTDEIRFGTTWSDVVPTPPVCQGDFNEDGVVNGSDLGFLLAFWGLPNADLDGDGSTGGSDLGLMLANWGMCP